jgi:hypothetical protein
MAATVMLLLFSCYIGNIILYTHIHCEGGVWVKHWHPMHGEHHHTVAEFVYTPNNETTFLPADMQRVAETVFRPLLRHLFTLRTTPLSLSAAQAFPSLRAPPVM